VTDIMGGISAATAEQSDGIAQINSAVAHLDQMTQQNAALVEESAAAASSMKDQARQLAELVATFKLNGSSPNKPSLAAPKPLKTLARPAPAPHKSLAAPAKRPAAAPAKKLAPPSRALPPPASKASGSKGDDDWETF
jgi:methyl-accepting chemotaxis protein